MGAFNDVRMGESPHPCRGGAFNFSGIVVSFLLYRGGASNEEEMGVSPHLYRGGTLDNTALGMLIRLPYVTQ